MKRFATTALASLACAAGTCITAFAGAQDKPSPLDALDVFVGDGACSGNVLAMGTTPAHATTGKVHGERTLDGRWLVIHYDADASTSDARPYHVVQYFGHDAAKKQFVDVAFDKSGAGYGSGTSAGWNGDVITFDNTSIEDGRTVAERDIFTRKGGSEISHTGKVRDKHGNWITTDEETCRKS